MKPIPRTLRLFALALALSAWNCGLGTSEPVARGGGSDTETLTGLVSLETGAPAARVGVKLVSPGYDPSRPDPDSLRFTLTDDSGAFKFTGLDSARRYNIIAGIGSQRAWAYSMTQRTGKDRKLLSLSRGIIFMVSLEYPSYSKKDSGIAYFPGTDILIRCNGVSPTKVDSIPEGVNHVVIASKAGWSHDSTFVIYQDSVDLKADKDGITCLQ
jgi:hypothetical protein